MAPLKGLERSVSCVGLTIFVSVFTLTACSNSKWHETQGTPKTGDPIAELQTTPTQPTDLKEGQTVFTNPDILRGRENSSQDPEESPVTIERGTPVVVVNPEPQGPDKLIEVTINTGTPDQRTVFVPPDMLSPSAVVPSNDQNAADRFFMVQNIATEKVRVYESCASRSASGACVNRLVLETEMTAGEDTPDESRRTILGSYRINKWFKFYEDNARLFPSWFAPNYPAVPVAGATIQQWLDRSLLPSTHPNSSMRGSFGWYTAQIEPRAEEQWTHGTFGWGADGDRFILATRDPQLNIVMDPRSQGCTRVENRAIAFMRELMPRGAKIVKIYAKEAYRNADKSDLINRAPLKWNYVLTKEGVDVDGPKSGARHASRVNADQILERGDFTLDQVPDAVPFVANGDGRTTSNGNLYSLPEASMKGVFLVDEGVLVNYQHPSELRVGGHTNNYLPSVVLSNDSRFVLPTSSTEETKTEVLDGTNPPVPRPTVINQ